MKSPLATVKKRFESKAKLVEAVQAFVNDELWLPRLSSDRGGAKLLKHVSNAKLLRLYEIFSEVKEKYGSRAKLVEAVLALENRTKDTGYRGRLERYPVPRLRDLLRSTGKRAARKAKAAAPKTGDATSE